MYIAVKEQGLNEILQRLSIIESKIDREDLKGKEWASKQSIAEAFDCSLPTIDRLRKAGVIKWRNQGRRVFINVQSVRDYFSK